MLGRITRLELIAGATVLGVLLTLVAIEPDILEAPFENEQTLLFTIGGTAIAAVAFVAMLRLRVPPVVRIVVLLVPFMVVNWWLLSPYFVDEVVDESFATSIADQLTTADEESGPSVVSGAPAEPSGESAGSPATGAELPANQPRPPATVAPSAAGQPLEQPAAVESTASAERPLADQPTDATQAPATVAPTEQPPPPSEPVLLGAGRFVGLAGHSGTGDAGIFVNPDGSTVLRFENFDIDNGPDLEVYLVPGPDQASLADGSIHLGPLKGNIGDQNYELPTGSDLVPGSYTALVWCEAFSVEFVGATITV